MATFKIIQKEKVLSSGLFPIYLRVTKDRKRRYISTGFSCEKMQWNPLKESFRRNFLDHEQYNSILLTLKRRAEKIFADAHSEGIELTLEEFDSLFFDFKKGERITVKKYWEQKIENLQTAKQVGNARSYKDGKNSFFKFVGDRKELYFTDITPDLLNRYENYLRSNNGTDGGISVKMRTIRSLYNKAIGDKLVSKDDYPFDTYKISKLKSANTKRALDITDVEKIRSLNMELFPDLLDSRNYFVFSYYTRGMNFYDMMLLEWTNIEGGKILYTRRKTKTNFSIKITAPVQEILDYYRSQGRLSRYIFPILTSENLTAQQIEYRKDKVLKKYNKDLKKIAAKCGIDTKITSYVARHSFATNLKQKGVSTDIISEAMGHHNVGITQVYLKQLESSILEEAVDKLL
ncbi:MAG: site-specific integrase [Weeksellaceae bacterium]|nr:site-specific integrase [Weeksellaceae bacterium]